MTIRVDCYLAVLDKFKKKYPKAHFEVITNTSKSPLAPSKDLLITAGIYKRKDGTKNPKMNFDDYAKLFKEEIYRSEEAYNKLKELSEIGLKKDVFLVCYEKDYMRCHRFIIAKLLILLFERFSRESNDENIRRKALELIETFKY